MIDWSKVNKKDNIIIGKIVARAKAFNPGLDGVDLNMDLCTTHISCPLKLNELLKADKFNFVHDVFGIINNLNRKTGELSRFLPRFAK